MMGVTLFPAATYTHAPVILNHDAPDLADAWLFGNLPCLGITKGRMIEPYSAALMLNNCCFDRNGCLTHVSPLLLRYLALCFDRVRFPTATKLDLRRVYSTRVPSQQTGGRMVPMRCAKSTIDAQLLKANDWRCGSRHHGHATHNDTMHPDAKHVTGVDVCTTCYHTMFYRPPLLWHSMFDVRTMMTPLFVATVIAPLDQRPLAHVLRGFVFLSHESDVTVARAVQVGKYVYIDPTMWAFRVLTNPRSILTPWEQVVQPPHVLLLRAMRIAKRTLARIPLALPFLSLLHTHVDVLMDAGCKQLIRTTVSHRATQHLVPGKTVNRNQRSTQHRQHYIGNELLFLLKVTDTVCMTKACALLHQRLIYNEPPLTVVIQLTGSKPMPSQPSIHAEFIPQHIAPMPVVTLHECERLTWEHLQHVISASDCRRVELSGNYTAAAQGIELATGSRVGGCFRRLVDLAHLQLHRRLSPRDTYDATFVLHSEPGYELQDYNTAAWSVQGTLHIPRTRIPPVQGFAQGRPQ